MSPSLPRPARKVRKINYYDGDAGSDVDVTFERPPLRDLRRSARVRSYAEAPSDVDRDPGSETDEDRSRISSAESQGLSQPSRTPKAIVMRRRRQPRRPLSTGRQQTLANLPKQKPRAVAHVGLRKPSIPETNALPWQHLEHGILVSILEYASAAMGDSPSNLDPHHSAVQWLLKVSRLSNPFHEAATTIIYRSPPIYDLIRAEGLLNLVRHPRSLLTTNYQTKVRRLNINVRALLASKKHSIDMAEMMRHFPLLQDLYFYHPLDESHSSSARELLRKRTWEYPDRLFDAMDACNIRLHSFEWNARFLKDMAQLRNVQARACLADQIDALVLRNFASIEGKHYSETELDQIQTTLRETIGILDLRRLEFRVCGVTDEFVAQLHFDSLYDLTLFRCHSLTSHGLKQLLLHSGRALRRLTLVGNSGVGLNFLDSLQSFTPRLNQLHIEFEPSSLRLRDDDDEPNLTIEPTWPALMETIHLSNLRATSREEISVLITSLIKASDVLIYLRHLLIKIILADASISWRDRAQVRTKWETALEKSFATDQSSDMEDKEGLKMDNTLRHSRRLTDRSLPSAPKPQSAGLSADKRPRRLFPCQISFTMDNQRPTSQQLGMDDFVDTDNSEGEEWTGLT